MKVSRERHTAFRSEGYSLVELLVVTAITLVVMGGVFSVLNPSQGTFRAQPEVSDVQQRLRVAVDTLKRDLLVTGASTYASAGGPLSYFFAPIMPYKMALGEWDPPGTFRTDAITLMFVSSTVETTIRDPMPRPSAELKVDPVAGCPSSDELCGFEEGMQCIIFDDTGAWDLFTVTHVQASSLHLQHRQQPDLSKAYQPGARIAQFAARTYYLNADVGNEVFELRQRELVDLPIVDGVVALRFDYFGDPLPPTLRKSVTDPVGPWTTYGPKPPALGEVASGSDYPAGENCVFQLNGGQQVPRLPSLTPGTNGLVPLTSAMLTDGPWCPSSTSSLRFDADLLRVRQVRVTLRLQALSKSLRGPAGVFFTRGGTARTTETLVPDQEVQFDVAPRNLNLGR